MTKPIKFILGTVCACLLLAVSLAVASAAMQEPVLRFIAMILIAVAVGIALIPLVVAVVIVLIEKFTRK
jgi:hypothetical protein